MKMKIHSGNIFTCPPVLDFSCVDFFESKILVIRKVILVFRVMKHDLLDIVYQLIVFCGFSGFMSVYP